MYFQHCISTYFLDENMGSLFLLLIEFSHDNWQPNDVVPAYIFLVIAISQNSHCYRYIYSCIFSVHERLIVFISDLLSLAD